MDKKLIFWVVAFMFLLILGSLVINNAVYEWRANYIKPDTTITIHNGKSDTVIVKKQLPAWLK